MNCGQSSTCHPTSTHWTEQCELCMHGHAACRNKKCESVFLGVSAPANHGHDMVHTLTLGLDDASAVKYSLKHTGCPLVRARKRTLHVYCICIMAHLTIASKLDRELLSTTANRRGTRLVVQKRIGIHAAGNRTTMKNFLHHGICSST